MKKVWILERYETKKELIAQVAGMYDMAKFAKENEEDANVTKHFEETAKNFEEMVNALPDDGGRWSGWEGKSNYKVFCNVAIDAINRDAEQFGKSKHQFRVVEAEIEDDAKYWAGYKFIKVNEGVTRYLYATRKNYRKY